MIVTFSAICGNKTVTPNVGNEEPMLVVDCNKANDKPIWIILFVNFLARQSMALTYVPLELKDGIQVVKLKPQDVKR